jgi:mannose-6-phosphate isomerase
LLVDPLTFQPILKERPWGGQQLEKLYGKPLPKSSCIGESWEISDRPGSVSVVDSGRFAGQDLHWLVAHRKEDLLGTVNLCHGRYPLLTKILDARETLSLQVHPPASVATRLGGEPKTELWYVAEAQPEAELFVGLKRGIDRALFEEKLKNGSVAECFHRLRVRPGDAMFVPSGRVHGIGAGCVIFEIQQNSDTTYRVFDWNRTGLDGKPRELHIAASLESIDFDDIEPQLANAEFIGPDHLQVRPLVSCPWFDIEVRRLGAGVSSVLPAASGIIAMVRGRVELRHEQVGIQLPAGRFALVPACLSAVSLAAQTESEILVVHPR